MNLPCSGCPATAGTGRVFIHVRNGPVYCFCLHCYQAMWRAQQAKGVKT